MDSPDKFHSDAKEVFERVRSHIFHPLDDDNAMVRSQAVVSLGQIGSTQSLGLLRERLEEDPSRDLRHQIELSIDQIQKQMGATDKLLNAYLTLDETEFGSVSEGDNAPD